MCGIVAASGKRNVIPILMDGLQRLEYRGYDSAGIAVLENNAITRIRKQGKVAELYKDRLLYKSDAANDSLCRQLGGYR